MVKRVITYHLMLSQILEQVLVGKDILADREKARRNMQLLQDREQLGRPRGIRSVIVDKGYAFVGQLPVQVYGVSALADRLGFLRCQGADRLSGEWVQADVLAGII